MQEVLAEPKRRRAPRATPRKTVPRSAVPPALIYEQWNGKPIYYRGYEDVLAGTKTIEEIMSSSDLQGVLVYLLGLYIGNAIDRKKYLIATNEPGLHLALNDNLGNDLVIFEKERVGKLKGKYFEVPPRVVIEVDIKADLRNFTNQESDYILQKSQKMLDFGVDKVVWVLTTSRKTYLIDRQDPRWYVVNWNEDIPVLDGCVLNIERLLAEEEVEY
jgi:Uma2 family endonuclease